MNTKHKHYDVIVAWAAGETVQYSVDEGRTWETLEDTPQWNLTCQYRIKPKPEYPTTAVSEDYLSKEFDSFSGTKGESLRHVANVAIRHAIDSGQVIIAPKGE